MRRFYAILSAAALAVAMLVVPASAHNAPVALTCIGTADVQATDTQHGTDNGTGLTALSDKWFNWQIEVDCSTDADSNTIEATLKASGTGAFGRCGASTASGGSGTVTFTDGHTTELSNIGWTSAGTVLAVTGNHDNGKGDGNEDGILHATVQASGGDECLAEPGARKFDVNIVGEAL